VLRRLVSSSNATSPQRLLHLRKQQQQKYLGKVNLIAGATTAAATPRLSSSSSAGAGSCLLPAFSCTYNNNMLRY
jgi:hypothetical protein